MVDWKQVRDLYMVPKETVFLNNGSYGPCPRRVFDALVGYLRRLEECPASYGGLYGRMIDKAKPRLASFVGAEAKNTVFVLNLTMGMNLVARGLRGLMPGDEIVTTDQEYGAVNNIWDWVARRNGCAVMRAAVPTPPQGADAVVEALRRVMTRRTRVLYCSHITTSTGLITPVKQLCAAARERGVLTVIDGAHAPGMIPVDVGDIGCDYYVGNCHKWLCAPKGTAFVAMREGAWERLDPQIVGWGWSKDRPETLSGNFESLGIHNVAAPNAVLDAVGFQEGIGREAIAARGRELAAYGRRILTGLPGVAALTPEDPAQSGSMAAYRLPPLADGARLTGALQRRGIVIPHGADAQGGRLRLSTHIYNTTSEVDLLAEALREAYSIR